MNSNFELYNSKWRYFEESIFTWLLIAFVDKLPISRDFIGSFGARELNTSINIQQGARGKYHTDFGGCSFIEFYLLFKTRAIAEIRWLPSRTFYNQMYQQEHEFLFEHTLLVGVFRQLQNLYYQLHIGSFRINFILSSFLLTNSKRLKNRSIFVKSLFMHKYDKLYNKIGNKDAKKDCTLNRLTCLFLKDIRPFGIVKPKNGEIYHEFNMSQWIELFEYAKGDQRDNNPFEISELTQKVLDAKDKVESHYRWPPNMTKIEIAELLYLYCMSLFERKSFGLSNGEYEDMNNDVFVSNINKLIKQIKRQQR